MVVKIRVVLHVVGLFLLLLAAMLLVPAAYALLASEAEWRPFLLSSVIVAATGGTLVSVFRLGQFRLYPREAFALTTLTWLLVSTFAALPLIFIEHISYTDAFFETMSGITTTGSTVLTGLDQRPEALLLWRSLLNWMGGIGFIVMGIAILPFLKIGGMRLFQSESSDWTGKVVPRFGGLAKTIGAIYLGLTLTGAALYWLAGMSAFDAINHAMSTVATGGYSTHDSSFGYFNSHAIQWIGVLFMMLGGMPFSLYVLALKGNARALFSDRQVRGFLTVLLLGSGAMALWLVLTAHKPVLDAVTLAAFNVTSIVTTTGFASDDYGQWGVFAAVLFFYLTFVGGCSGSTAGGIKIFRFQVAFMLLRHHLFRLIHPNAMLHERYNNREVTSDIVRSILNFSFTFAATIGLLALALSALGLDFQTSLTGAATAVANVGPGLGPVVGPAGNFATLPDTAKWLLSFGMLAGRLEIMTVVVVLTPMFWRN
jgi:trk system potassium uptake protein TrkH